MSEILIWWVIISVIFTIYGIKEIRKEEKKKKEELLSQQEEIKKEESFKKIKESVIIYLESLKEQTITNDNLSQFFIDFHEFRKSIKDQFLKEGLLSNYYTNTMELEIIKILDNFLFNSVYSPIYKQLTDRNLHMSEEGKFYFYTKNGNKNYISNIEEFLIDQSN